MPRVSQYQGLRIDGWPDGLNKDADSSRLSENELSEALNMRIGPRGEMRLRTGYSRFDSNITNQASFLYPYRDVDGYDFLICISADTGDNFWYSDASSAVTEPPYPFILAPAHINYGGDLNTRGVGFAAANHKLYVSQKIGAGVYSIEGSGGGTAVVTQVTSIPAGKHLAYRHGRLFSINTSARPTGVFYSELLTPETFAVDDYIEVNPDDGYEIQGAEVFGDDLILIKDNSVWKLSGRTPSSFTLYQIDSHRGTVSPRAITQLRGRLFFYDRDTGIWAFDGAAFELVSDPFNNYLMDRASHDRAYWASAYTGDDRAYFSIPWTDEAGVHDGDYRTFVFHGDTESWTEYDNGFFGRTDYLDVRYQGLLGTDGVYYADEDSDLIPPSVTPIEGTFRTGWFEIAGPGSTARVRRIESIVKAPVTVTAQVNMYANYNDDTPVASRSFIGGPAPSPAAVDTDERRIAIDGWGGRYESVMFEVVTSDAPFQMNNLSIFYTGNIDVRGAR